MAQLEIKFAKFRPYQINFKIFDVKLTKHEQNFALPNNLTSDLSQFEIKYGQLLMASFRILLGGASAPTANAKGILRRRREFLFDFFKENSQDTPHTFTFFTNFE